ncbi:S-adenosyl-L-methionine-dependent methyltransferase [Mycobacterium gallinarum]|uniref:S-adenosyl-L-methionine-dependent methyltransferase n=1 Tax=Mycobacterium gallinarum TaxID=39689 RepID=A0A9W4FDY4_9MYCO|nr:SAM-dependent methyltransferase [Mycobacterium gallinarum]BBY91178.1 S-adenosyl-L-methionine-dependent methyltransferase [Mycobacterium gallinarum]
MADNGPAQTAFGPMVLAAVEQYEAPERRLVDDDLALAFLPAGLRGLVKATRLATLRRLMIGATERAGQGLWANLACRKRFIDETLDDALPDIDAVVILGAGMDTRPYRLARRSDVPVYEVDLPVNIERKKAAVRRVLGEAPASVRLVPVDFERDDLAAELTRAGHRSGDRAFFVWEGVTQYLTADAVHATFEYLRSAAPSSRLVFTYVRQDFIDGRNLYGARSAYRRFREKQQLWKFGLETDDIAAFVAQYGWRLIEQAGPDYFLRHYVEPSGRKLTASQLEWTAYAEKT